MRRPLIFANVSLLLAVGLLSWRLSESVRQFDRENKPDAIHFTKSSERIEALPPLTPPPKYNLTEFGSIPARNVFSETRDSQPADVPADPSESVPELKEKPVLVGVVLSDNENLAAVLDPVAPSVPAGRRRGRTLRVGDGYQGYTVTEISADQLVLSLGPRREVIPLRDTGRRNPAGTRTPLIATRIVPFGGEAAPGLNVATAAIVASPRPVTPAGPRPAPAPVAAAVQVPPRAPQVQGTGQIVPAASQPFPSSGGVDYHTNVRVLKTPTGTIISYPP